MKLPIKRPYKPQKSSGPQQSLVVQRGSKYAPPLPPMKFLTRTPLKALMQQSSDPDLLKIISDTAKQLSPGTPLKVLADGSWQFDDNAGLHFEPCEGTLLAVLRMPEQHLDAIQLMQLLALGAMDWPTPIAASLCANEAQALLFTRLRVPGLDADILTQAVLTLLQARKHWLQETAR
jgi:hypothetical protein